MNNIEKQAERFGMEEDDGFAVMNVDKRDGFKAGAEWMRSAICRSCSENTASNDLGRLPNSTPCLWRR